MCLGMQHSNHSAAEITGELHESTLGSVFLNSSYVGVLDNQGHNGKDTATSISAAPSLLP